MAHSHPSGYMQWRPIRLYYKQLDSGGNIVGHMWHNTLMGYFSPVEDFGLQLQPFPAPSITKPNNEFIIRFIMKGSKWKPLVLITNDRVSLETSSTTWEDAVKQLTEYMLYARTNSGKEEEDMFGIVAVGHFSRFYILKPPSTTLIDHPATGGNSLEFKNNETDIVNLLLEIKAQALLVPSDWS